MEKWFVTNKKADFKEIGRKFGIDPVTARIIRNRDVTGDDNIRLYLSGTLSDLPDAHLLKDADRLVSILCDDIRNHRKIRIIGDYDIDGVCSTYILWKALGTVGAAVDIAIPDRMKDGYGLNRNLIEDASIDGIQTILTCDNGIAALEAIATAKEMGMTVLVTDHHQVPFEEKDGKRVELKNSADAVVNPHQEECLYPYKDLCGAGVAWLVVTLLYDRLGIPSSEALPLLEFAAFATVGDVMPLTGVNRILVKEGLKLIHKTENTGLKALIAACGLMPEQIDSYHFGFILGPCVNASGRLETAVEALNLFRETDEAKAEEMAQHLVALNEERKNLTTEGVEQAVAAYETNHYENDRVLVIYLPDVHESIAGIIAGRIRERYYRPVFILTKSADGGVKGSGRSVEEYSMYEEMCKCSTLLSKFGGHPMAAGLSLPEENVDEFRRQMNENCTLAMEDLVAKVHIDVPMPVSYVTEPLIREFSLLAPFGTGNPKPVFADKNLSVVNMRVMGKNRNVVKFSLRNSAGVVITAIWFGDCEEILGYIREKFGEEALNNALSGRENPVTLSIVYNPQINEFRGVESIEFIIQHYC